MVAAIPDIAFTIAGRSTLKGGIMRFYEGNYAYEIERLLDPATQLQTGWRYNVYRVRPLQELLRSGEAATQEEAEKAGRKTLAEVMRTEAKAKEGAA
jgi:hypothetical protein